MFFNSDEKKMLLDLFRLYGPSKGEKPILDFIVNVLKENKIPFEQDDHGNIYCMNHKNVPMLSAHTDCVGGPESGHYVRFVDIYPYGNDEIMKGLGNIGGDDKCGVFLILLYLLSGKPINAIFSICEEIGGLDGIKYLLPKIKDNEVFKTIPYCIVLDRRSFGDIICSKNDYGTKEFEDALHEIGKKYYYEPVTGGCSDMNTIKEYMNGCNLSVGYYNPHSTTEFVSIGDLHNTWEYLQELILKMPRNLPKKQIVYTTPSTTNYYGKTYYEKKKKEKEWPGKDDYYDYYYYDY